VSGWVCPLVPFYGLLLFSCVLPSSVIAEHFRYLGTSLTNKNYFHEEIKCRLQAGNACYYLVQNLFSSSLLSKNIKVKIYKL